MTSSASGQRSLAIAVADSSCPRCGAARAADQRYCLDCGLALPVVSGGLAALRRRWIGRLGWYPGDWVWLSLVALVVAAAGTAAAIVVANHRAGRGVAFDTAPAAVSLREPATRVPTATSPTSRVGTSKLPTAPEPGTSGPAGRTVWPASERGWTIVLVSFPKTFGRVQALQTATHAAKAGLDEVGVIDSSRYASLQAGYFVVFTGIYGSKTDADVAVATARQAGFAGAYSREIAR